MIHALAAFLLAALQQPPARETVEIPGTKLKFEVVSLPGGKGLQPFRLGVREVTWAEFNAFHKNPKDVDGVTRPTNADTYFGDVAIPKEFLEKNRPLTNVRWHSAMMYCEWLSRKTGSYYRLPTESEWEHAARAGSDKDSPEDPNRIAWHKGNSEESTHVGGGKAANALGLHDMIGNVWEYVLEPHAPPEYGPVLKGGCWSSPARELKFAHRQTIPLKWYEEDSNFPRSVWWLTTPEVSIGFRVACAADVSDRKEREEYGAKIEVKFTGHKERIIKTNNSPAPYRAVTGEIRNGGARALDEVELKVYYLEADGKPHMIDISGSKPGRGSFSKVWPVLANSHGDAAARAPLKPGETRAFALDLPQSYDIENRAGAKVEFGGTVTAVRFSK
ncbi:MAG TPA: SUMF1/EgtB/PvdO family nonheme iron enzyme [Planctomycetota bacterium]|nr:SUMF1/EgtB/PvdO family nonheme iron enzyme [Planctomycetota bacterium]